MATLRAHRRSTSELYRTSSKILPPESSAAKPAANLGPICPSGDLTPPKQVSTAFDRDMARELFAALRAK